MNRITLLVSVTLLTPGWPAVAQSPRAANPERPTVATHAYAVAPGYVEVEQGISARGSTSLSAVTSWDVNVKIGIAPHIQLGIFGPAYLRTGAGHGIGDWGAALKMRTDLSAAVAVAVVPTLTVPTGNEHSGLGAGRALGQLPMVLSVNGPAGVHADLNAGPLGIGAGRPQWLTTASFSRPLGALGVAAELFRISAGAAGPRQAGLLGALLVTPVQWLVIDVGGTIGLGSGSADAVFLGATTNFGRL
ncbi:MAG TPA: hypothetical protein VL563_14175 [Gemmatimonadales bacterium]|jgi:hypothetical protein|nr:hypothetical protein [Gemmatimonadales bacterium]